MGSSIARMIPRIVITALLPNFFDSITVLLAVKGGRGIPIYPPVFQGNLLTIYH